MYDSYQCLCAHFGAWLVAWPIARSTDCLNKQIAEHFLYLMCTAGDLTIASISDMHFCFESTADNIDCTGDQGLIPGPDINSR